MILKDAVELRSFNGRSHNHFQPQTSLNLNELIRFAQLRLNYVGSGGGVQLVTSPLSEENLNVSLLGYGVPIRVDASQIIGTARFQNSPVATIEHPAVLSYTGLLFACGPIPKDSVSFEARYIQANLDRVVARTPEELAELIKRQEQGLWEGSFREDRVGNIFLPNTAYPENYPGIWAFAENPTTAEALIRGFEARPPRVY